MRICDKGIYRDMTEEEIEELNRLPDPEQAVAPEEIVNILTGEAE